MFKRLITGIVCITFIFSSFPYAYAQPSSPLSRGFSVNQLPVPGTMVEPSEHFVPILLKGLVIHPDKPFKFDFIVDSGNDSREKTVISEQSERMIKYFLTALTSPSKDLWVNLSPFEHDRIITNTLGRTAFGRDMLAEDYLLKQLTASLIYPQKDLGKTFWNRVYREVKQKTGNTDVPINTFNKVWIVPNGAEIFEKDNAVYITKASLKVMSDEDYLSLQKHSSQELDIHNKNSVHAISSNIIRQIIIPEIEKEVNDGRNFALLRQIYYATILAKWYREEIQSSLISQMYVDKNKIAGIDIHDNAFKEAIYQRYIRAYKKGVFNYIQEDNNALTGQVSPRKYFSGGAALDRDKIKIRSISEKAFEQYKARSTGALYAMTTVLRPERSQIVSGKSDAAMTAHQVDVLRAAASKVREDVNKDISWMSPGSLLPSYEILREQTARMGAKAGKPMSPQEYFSQDFEKLMAIPDKNKIIVFADHQDLDAFISPLVMAYLLHCQLAAVDRADTHVIPVLYGKKEDIAPSIRHVLEKFLGNDIFNRIHFVGKEDLKDLHNKGYAVQVDSTGNPVWAVFDHHNIKDGTALEGPGSRWGLKQGPSAAFMVAQEFKASGLKIDPLIALLILSSTMSDTLNFMENLVGSPTIHKDLVDLKEIALREYPQSDFKWINEIVFGIPHNATARDIIRDRKKGYWHGEKISQCYFLDRVEYEKRLVDIITEIKRQLRESGGNVWVHMGTDVDSYESLVMVVPGEGHEALQGSMDAVLAKGGRYLMHVDGIKIYVRKEMLRKNLAENPIIKSQMKAILIGHSLAQQEEHKDPEWWHTASGIFTYATSEFNKNDKWAKDIAEHYSDDNDSEMRTAISMMLLYSDERGEKIRQGASWIASQKPQLLGKLKDKRTQLKTLWDVISSDDSNAEDILLDWYMKSVHPRKGYTDYFFMDLFFNHLQAIILHEHGPRYGRAMALVKAISAEENQNEPDLASELRSVGLNLKAGKSWREAIRALEEVLSKVGEGMWDAEIERELRPLLSKYFDAAMMNALKNSPLPEGGIDLNGININRAGKINRLQFGQAQIATLMEDDFGGFSLKVIKVTPIVNLLQELSIK